MGQRPTKAAGNMYCRCRLEAADRGGYDRLKSRMGAAELLGVHESTLADWELFTTRPPAEAVVKMADTYGTPELLNYYCTSECPIGRQTMCRLELKDIDRAILEIAGALGKCGGIRDDLLDITEDGIISEEEKPRLKQNMDALADLTKRVEQLKLSIRKLLGEEV